MASSRKKQDDKLLKILRELVSLPGNKDCFDCKQRGPTYVNTTIGSFVCTRCSGILRGLTPPHRIKSISMATFTQEEIDLLRQRGNEYCRKTWLAHYDGNQVQDTKDEQNVRDFMVAKYEKKRYYQEFVRNGMAPSVQSPVMQQPAVVQPPQIQAKPQPAVVRTPSTQLPNMNAVRNIITSPTTGTFAFPSAATSDPFGSATPVPAQPSFANFDNNPVFSSPPIPALPSSASYPIGLKSAARQPSEDKYAALKDLDSLMKQQQEPVQNNSFTGGLSDWNNGNIETVHAPSPANPFATSFGQTPFTQAPNGFNPSPSNPFTSAGFDTGSSGTAWSNLPTSHSMPFPVTWGTPSNLTVGPSNPRNPFL